MAVVERIRKVGVEKGVTKKRPQKTLLIAPNSRPQVYARLTSPEIQSGSKEDMDISWDDLEQGTREELVWEAK